MTLLAMAPVVGGQLLTVGGCVPFAATAPTAPTTPAARPTTAPAAPPATTAPAAPAATTAPTAPTVAPPAPTAAPRTAPPAGVQAGALAEQGKGVYDTYCQACHGNEGQGVVGPALWGSRASPAKYGPAAADWYGYIRASMPQNNPNSLSAEEYLQVTTYLLVQNRLVQPSQPVSEPGLVQIRTER